TTRGTIGKAAILPPDAERGILHPCLLRVQVDDTQLGSEFLRLLIQESGLLSIQLALQSNATTIEVIYSYTMANLVIPVPPRNEQTRLLEVVGEKVGEIDRLFCEATKAIALLNERRSALIAAAVTGQIDVRGAVSAEAA